MNSSDVTLLESDTVFVEFTVELLHHILSHIGFKIKNLMQEDGVDKVSDVFFDFSSQQFIKSSSTELIYKHMNKLLIVLWKSECEMKIDVDVCIILCRAFLHWCIIVNDVLREEAHDSPIAGIAPMGTWIHERLGCSTVFFHNCEVCWYVQFDIAATALVACSNHCHNALIVGG